MIRVKAFRYYSNISSELPETQLEHFLVDHGIMRDQIISITASTDPNSETIVLCYEK